MNIDSLFKINKLEKESSKYLTYFTIKLLICLGFCKFGLISLDNLRNGLNSLKEKMTSKDSIHLNYIEALEFQLDHYLKQITGFTKNIKKDFKIGSEIDPGFIMEWLDQLTALCSEINSIKTSTIIDFMIDLYEYILSTENKEKGEFYTPCVICDHIIQNTLFENLDKKIESIKLLIKTAQKDEIKEEFDKLFDLKILDPSCGVGKFLIRIIPPILSRYYKLFQEISKDILFKPKEDTITIFHHFFGIDLDEQAIIIARYNIILLSIEIVFKELGMIKFEDLKGFVEKLCKILLNNIQVKDFLLDDVFQHRKFNYIIGNPPYINIKKLPKNYKEKLRNKFKTAVKQFDLYSIFIEQCHNYLNINGFCGLIIPDSFLGRSHFGSIRNLILENAVILQIDQIKGVFKDPTVSNVILIFKRVSSPAECQNNIIKLSRFKDPERLMNDEKELVNIPQKYFLSQSNYRIQFIRPEFIELLSQIQNNKILLESITEIHRGEELGKKSLLISQEDKEHSKGILFGKDVQRFHVHFSNNYILERDIQKIRYFSLYFNPKIVIRQLGNRINAAFDERGVYVTLQTIYNLKITDRKFDYLTILGILNSELLYFYYSIKYNDKQLFARILLENLKNIPIAVPENSLKEEISELVQKIISLKNKDLDSKKEEELLDSLIYDLYEIPMHERIEIKKYLKKG